MGERQTSVMPVCVNTKCTLMSKIHTCIYIYIYLHVLLLQHFVYCLPLKINKVDLKKKKKDEMCAAAAA